MKKTRILLINAINTNIEVENRYPNLGLGYIAAAVKKYLPDENIEFKIIDKNIKSIADEYKPDLVGITSVSQNYHIAVKYADFFNSVHIPVVLGGIHITYMPESLPRSVTAACIGEGELTFLDLVKAFISGRFYPESFINIPGIIYWENNEIKKTRLRDQIKDIDSLPFPDRTLIPIRHHTYIFTSRGCPYNCVFCASTRFWRTLRYFSAEYVVDEIDLLVNKYKVDMISIFDDIFVLNRQRIAKIIQLLEAKRLLERVKFTCSCRANIVDKELAELLSKMGVVSVGMGLESGNNEVLQYLKGSSVSVEKNHEAINVLKEDGISVNGSFIIGSPDETKEQILETYDFIRKSNLDLFDVYLLTPLPGTPVWDYAVKNKIIQENFNDWARLDVNVYRQSEDSILSLSKTLSKKELISLYNKFRRLRLQRNIAKIINHPMRRDIPYIGYNLLKEYISGFFKKET